LVSWISLGWRIVQPSKHSSLLHLRGGWEPGRDAIHACGTPLVELARLTEKTPGRVLAKLKYLNPGSSKKDRIAMQMIEEAEAEGKLVREKTYIEASVTILEKSYYFANWFD
jgi:hypothetical protein